MPRLAGLPRRASPLGDDRARREWARLAPARRRAVDRAFANVGKAIAAFERGLRPRPTRFDRYVAALGAGDPGPSVLSAQELDGLRLFVGEAHCVDCHSGPLLTNGEFHVTGLARADPARAAGLALLRADQFNCLGPYSDAAPRACALRFAPATARRGALKPPSLRGVGGRAPYMHDGRFRTLERVLCHYDDPPPRSELHPLGLDGDQLDALAAFLRTI